jgi:hypothetical protein
MFKPILSIYKRKIAFKIYGKWRKISGQTFEFEMSLIYLNTGVYSNYWQFIRDSTQYWHILCSCLVLCLLHWEVTSAHLIKRIKNWTASIIKKIFLLQIKLILKYRILSFGEINYFSQDDVICSFSLCYFSGILSGGVHVGIFRSVICSPTGYIKSNRYLLNNQHKDDSKNKVSEIQKLSD